MTDQPDLYDLVDRDQLSAAIEAKHVRQQVHPTEPLAILNYTEACVYEDGWNPTTLACRGLIYNTDSREVVARPFAKFFNYGQTGAAEIPLDAEVSVTDKADGSLGILYPLPSGGWAVATRGSFTSDQAVFATARFENNYSATASPGRGWTLLFEIIYPENRIVLDYGDTRDLYLLGAVNIETGSILEPDWFNSYDWPGPKVESFGYPTLADALAAEPRANAEGLVIRRRSTGEMVKLKQEDYVALHKIVTGLSARTVWQHLVNGLPIEELIKPLPDEFHTWVLEVAHELNRTVDRRENALRLAFHDLIADLPHVRFVTGDKRAAKKEFALVAKDHADAWAMFALYDGKDILPKLWDAAKPEAFVTPSGRTFSEDEA